MLDRVDTLAPRRSPTRREFTLDAALAILAACVITVTETACGSSSAAPTPAATPVADVNGIISANHGHVAVVTGAQITTGAAVSLDIQGMATHKHTVAISQADLATLKSRQTVTSTSSTDASHSHTVTFTPV
jgi:hypothetical protein